MTQPKANSGIVRFGIVGTGMIARMHARAIMQSEYTKLIAVYDAIPERAQAFAEDFDTEWEADYDTFLQRQDIDAVTLATPSGVRADVAIPAAEAGKHLLCEKPLEVTVKRAQSIVDACEENHVKLGCVFQSRTTRTVNHITAALEENRFGKLVMANVQVPWHRSISYYSASGWRGTWELDGGGALMNQSIHIIDLLLYFLGDPESLFAYTENIVHTDIEVEDTAVACVRFHSGALATITVTTAAAIGFPRRLEVCGSKGSFVMLDDRLTRWQFEDQNDIDDAIFSESVAGEGIKGGAGDPAAINCEGHRRQIEDLALAILKDTEPMVSGSEAIRAVELIRGIYESVETGRPYTF